MGDPSSATRQGYTFELLGRRERYARHMDKLRILLGWLHHYRGNATHLLYSDSFDCWMQKLPGAAIEAYRTSRSAVLVSSHKRSVPFETVDAFFPQVPGG